MARLLVVATPIGNLGDISPRAAQALEEAAVIAAESVRRTRKLLSHLGIRGKKLVSCRESNRQRAAQWVLGFLDSGLDVALVSDSGTPGVSDPGSLVVERAAQAGHRLVPVAGPSALAAALSVAGIPGAPVVFLGFCPAKSGARKKLIAQGAATGWPLVLYEAPHRLARAAQDLLEVLGDRAVVLCRELTKVNEEVAHTTLQKLALAGEDSQAKGEITLVVHGGRAMAHEAPSLDQEIRRALAEDDAPPSRMAKAVAKKTGRARDEVYRRILEIRQGLAGSPGAN